MKERRSHPRVQSSHPVLYFSDTHPKSRVSGTLDISLGGIRMETTPFSPVIGEGLDVSIAIHPRMVKCRGKVVRLLQVLDESAAAG